MTSTTLRRPNPGYIPHDHATEWSECDSCALRLGPGASTEYDAAYFGTAANDWADAGDPAVCPRCGGLMCLPASEVRS